MKKMSKGMMKLKEMVMKEDFGSPCKSPKHNKPKKGGKNK